MNDGGIEVFLRFAADVAKFSLCGFLEARLKFAVFDGGNHARDVFVEALLHFGELRFELLDALLLALYPFGAEFLAFFFEGVALGGHLLAQAIEFIAAAVEIGDEVGGFARFGSEEFARALDDLRRKAEALGDGDAARSAGDANHEAVSGAEIDCVKFDSGVDDAGSGGSVGLEAIVMGGGKDDAAFGAKFVEEGDG